MQKSELNDFYRMWNNYRTIFNHQPLSTDAALMVFEMFEGYSYDQVVAGMKSALAKAKEMPAVGTVVDCIKELNGEGEQAMRKKAEAAFQLLNKTASFNGSTYDWVIEDSRTCAAVSRLWGTPQRFVRMCNDNSRDYSQLQRNFIAAWIGTTKAELEDPRLPHVFLGSYQYREEPIVLFCGNYDRCAALGDRYYRDFMNVKPRYPQKPGYWSPERQAQNRALAEKRDNEKTNARVTKQHFGINAVEEALAYINERCDFKKSETISKVSDYIKELYVRQHSY